MPSTLVFLSCANFCSAAVMRAVDPLIPLLASEFEVAVTDAAIVATAFALSYGLCQFVGGPIGERVGKLRLIAIATALCGLSTLATAFAGSLADLAVLRLVAGATAGAIIPLGLAYVGDSVPADRRQVILSRYVSGQILGLILGPAIAGVVSELFSWRVVFALFGALFLLVSLLIVLQMRVRGAADRLPQSRVRLVERYKTLLSSRQARITIGAVLIEGMLLFGGLTYIGAFVVAKYDVGFQAAGLIAACFGIGGLAYVISGSFFMRFLAPARLIMLGGAILTSAFIGLALRPPLWLVIVLVTMSGMGFYLVHNILQNRGTSMLPEATGVAMSAFALSFFTGQSLGIAGFGAIIDAGGFEPAFLSIGLGLGAGSLVLARLVRA